MFVSGHFGQLSPTAVHSADCWFDSGMKWWIHVSSIITYLCKNSLLLCWNNALNHQHIVVFDWLWANAVPTLNTAFSLTNIHAKWWIHCPLISHATLIYDQPKRVFWDNYQIWATWAFSIICVCMTTFKVSIPPLYHCFWQRRVQIMLIKPLLCLNSIFSIRKQCFINTWNSNFSIVLKICNSSFT